jgi:hypothetical protein
MPLRLTADEERPFAPFVLAMAASIGGLIVYDLIFWLRSSDHRPSLSHAPGYGVLLLLMWLALAWVARSPLVRTAWLVLALNELLSIVTLSHPEWSPWWRRDVLLAAWAAILFVWGWRHSAGWMRLLSLLVLAGSVVLGQLMLEVPRRGPIVRPNVAVRPK